MNADQKKNGSKTSPFGSPSRVNHDSSKFYSGRLYEGLPREKEDIDFRENRIPEDSLDKIFCKSAENMAELPDNSVHLMVTSPPYNVGKLYDKELTLDEYRNFLLNVWKETQRVLVVGGRVCINVANLGRKPYIPLHAFIIQDMLKLGFLMRGEIIWNKGATASSSIAWGTYLSAKNPVLRDSHEYILVFSKETFTRGIKENLKSTITKNEFIEYTKSVWSFNAESATRIGHPAPFPVELPSRCIKLYTFEGENVLDPFMGSGTTAVAALLLKRRFVGYEIDPNYIKLAERRINEVKNQSKLPMAKIEAAFSEQ
ncbi:MAG: site-specific DNA-methyltransferase [Candidatus Micrarchaeaceae archaeon]